jgi:hypothetical protein
MPSQKESDARKRGLLRDVLSQPTNGIVSHNLGKVRPILVGHGRDVISEVKADPDFMGKIVIVGVVEPVKMVEASACRRAPPSGHPHVPLSIPGKDNVGQYDAHNDIFEMEEEGWHFHEQS